MNCKSLLLWTALTSAPALMLAADGRPHCDAKHLGQLWPESKSEGAMTIQQLAQSGELEVCSRTQEWRYGWEHLTITIGQLKVQPKKPVSSPGHSQQNQKAAL